MAKSFSPNEFGIKYINNLDELSKLIVKRPSSTFLIDYHSTGTVIKTYYQKYRIVYGDLNREDIIVRVSSNFAKKYNRYLGMSLINKLEENDNPIYTPIPPGSIFIGNKKFGFWVRNRKAKTKDWKFFTQYKSLPNMLGWGKFSPDFFYYENLHKHIEDNRSYWGLNNEFGPNGEITTLNFPNKYKRSEYSVENLDNYLNKILRW